VLDALAGACHDGVRLAFSYTARDGAPTERYVEPYRLVVLARRWYLLAFDIDRDDWRTFRVDRITAPRATVAHFSPRDAPDDPVAFVRGSIERVPRRYRVVADVAAGADAVETRIGSWADVERIGPRRCRVHMAADELEWPIFALMQVDADFVVQEPPELKDHLSRLARRFTASVR
jgi:predicted DNA-binding transcriptional regulator YafY